VIFLKLMYEVCIVMVTDETLKVTQNYRRVENQIQYII